ncbi:MAG TPA: hypothetical protein VGN01_18725 [Acidobacteriaceae bacterium]|jgi:hypothetical protein
MSLQKYFFPQSEDPVSQVELTAGWMWFLAMAMSDGLIDWRSSVFVPVAEHGVKRS